MSIHALREEGDSSAASSICALVIFLSTPSARRATKEDRAKVNAWDISIHALREEGDQ